MSVELERLRVKIMANLQDLAAMNMPEDLLRSLSPKVAFCGGSWACYDSHDYLDEYIAVHGAG
jgi:hypothetical protein